MSKTLKELSLLINEEICRNNSNLTDRFGILRI